MSGRLAKEILGVAFAAALGLLCALIAASPAAAHAQLLRAEPSDGAVLEAAPRKLVLTFNEPVSPLVVRLVRPLGEVSLLTGERHGNSVVVTAPPFDRGTHVLSWRVVSADGHPIAGSVVFSIGTVTNSGNLPPDTASRATSLLLWLAKLVLYLGLFFGLGSVVFEAWLVEIRKPSRAAVVLLAAGMLSALAAAGLQGLDALGLAPGAIATAVVWHTGFSTSFGLTVILALGALALALIAASLPQRNPARVLSALALLGTGAALAASGHASAASPQWLMRPAVFVHIVGVTIWAGALLPLTALLRHGDPAAASALRRFSAAIPFVVLALVAAGIALAVVQVETPAALLSTNYGLVLAAKLGVVLAIFLLAAVNRWRFTGASLSGERAAARRLARLVVIETMLFVLVLGLVALWRFTPPPRALSQSVASVHIHTDKLMAELSVTPDRAGPVRLTVMLMTGDFQPLVPKEVEVILSLPEGGIEEIRRAAELGSDGQWHVRGLVVPVPGRWTAQIDVLVTDFESVQIKDTIAIGVASGRAN